MKSTHNGPTSDGMDARDALRVLAHVRGNDHVVVTHQGAARLWPQIQQHPLDFHYNPSTMGGAVPFGLGLALSSAGREIIVVSGDGALLMSLGSLVTVAAAGAKNLTIVLMDNGIYEVTGGQKTPGAAAGVDFAAMARSAGFSTSVHFTDIALWRGQAKDLLSAAGPRFICLRIKPVRPGELSTDSIPVDQQIDRLRRLLI